MHIHREIIERERVQRAPEDEGAKAGEERQSRAEQNRPTGAHSVPAVCACVLGEGAGVNATRMYARTRDADRWFLRTRNCRPVLVRDRPYTACQPVQRCKGRGGVTDSRRDSDRRAGRLRT
jgi:hypothetical protein